jgi:hypothetical protein
MFPLKILIPECRFGPFFAKNRVFLKKKCENQLLTTVVLKTMENGCKLGF